MMNKIVIITLLILCSVFKTSAQKSDEHVKNFNEIKLNGLYLVLGAFDITYERTLNEESAIGATLFVPFDDEIRDDVEYYFSPYYRFYFGKKYAAGFFLEGFGMLNSSERDFDLFFENENKEFVKDFALGIGFGAKWKTKRGFIGELNYGIGRNLFSDEAVDFVLKVGLSIGYRF